MGKELRLAVVDRSSTRVSGSIGIEAPRPDQPPLAGLGIIDPHGMIMDDDEADAMAAEVVKRWNLFPELCAALHACADQLASLGAFPAELLARDVIYKSKGGSHD